MTPRERVLCALHHQTPDRVPVDLSGHRSSGISAMAYARLRRHLGLPERPVRVYDVIQQLAVVDEDILGLFEIDTVELGRAFALGPEHWTDWELPDGTACLVPSWAKPVKQQGRWVLLSASGRPIGHMPQGVLYFEQCHYPLAEGGDLSHLSEAMEECIWTAIHAPPGPLAAGEAGKAALAEGARRLRAQTDRAIIALFGGNLLEMGQILFRHDQFFMMLAAEPEKAHQFLDGLVEMHLRNLDRFLEAVGPHIDIILFGDDLGTQMGPQVSPAMYREFFQPRQRLMWQRAKERAKVKVLLHCCGGVRELLPGLIEAGLDAINPVQISCRGMEAAGLKREFGRQLTFWGGGCDTRTMLSRGTPSEIREHVRRLVDVWQPDGGFVFQQVHNILADVPPANIVAMYEAVLGKKLT